MSRLWAPAYISAWQAAKIQGHSRFEGPNCQICQTTTRFTSGRQCVSCQSRRAKQHKERHPLRKVIRAAEWRAKRDSLEFDLSEDDLVIPDTCPVLGIAMTTPSIDRVDNTRGYTKDNVAVISWEANQLKNGLTITQITQLYKYVTSFNG